MSIFGSFFSSNSDKNSVNNWNLLESIDQWKTLIEQSFKHPVVVFKHSTRCIISRMALRDFESKGLDAGTPQTFFLLDLLEHRSVSDAIASDTLVHHQSPQVIVMKAGKAVYNSSHDSISYDSILSYL